jgi:acyl-CoA dehydrogenase
MAYPPRLDRSHGADMTAPLRSDIVQDLDQFRSEVREWLAANCPDSQRQPITPEEQYFGGRNASFASEDARLWLERMRDQGWKPRSSRRR